MERSKEIQDKSEKVNNYYNQFTDSYLSTYGEVIQAFRPKNTTELHQYIINSADLKAGQFVLDAGCGVGGPACYFASNAGVEINGITISDKQASMANQLALKKGVSDKCTFVHGDYHNLSTFYKERKFDRILFLESLGHAQNAELVLQEAVKVLQIGGSIYIKDFFPFEIENEALRSKHERVIKAINDSYCYNVLELHSTISAARKLGLQIDFIRKFKFQDDITARSDFEAQNKVDLFGEMEEFRVAEWLELKFSLPEYPLF